MIFAIEDPRMAEYIIYKMSARQIARVMLDHSEIYPDFETLPASLARMIS